MLRLFNNLLGDLLIIGLSGFLLWHFSLVWQYGQVLVGEPNLFIRTLETFLLAGILVYGLVRIFSTLKGGKSC